MSKAHHFGYPAVSFWGCIFREPLPGSPRMMSRGVALVMRDGTGSGLDHWIYH